MTENNHGLKAWFATIFAWAMPVSLTPSFTGASSGNVQAKSEKIYAQKLVQALGAKHPEVSGIEVAATPPKKHLCVTIAATEPKELGAKCDEDESTAMRTDRPFVEKEEDGFDVTLPLHDAAGKIIGTMGLDFKPKPGQKESEVLERARHIAQEFEKQAPSKARLFEPEK